MNEGRDRDAGRLFGGTLALLRANAGLVAGALVTLTVLGVVSDLLGRNGQAVNLVSLPATLLFQYEVTFASLAHLGLSERRGRRRFWALLGLNILYGLGVFVGLVLLLLPGLYLYVRWSVAVPVLVAEEAGIGESLTRSGEEIAGRFWPVAGLFLLTTSPWVLALVGGVIVPHRLALVSSLVLNLPINLALIMGWCAAVAVYAAGKDDNRLAQVFA